VSSAVAPRSAATRESCVIPSGCRTTSRVPIGVPSAEKRATCAVTGISVGFARMRFVRNAAFSRIGASDFGEALAYSAGENAGRAWPTEPPEDSGVELSLSTTTLTEDDVIRIAP